MSAIDSDQSHHTRLGILLVVAGMSMAALIGALMKLLSADLHPIQIAWFRFLGFALLLLPVVVSKIGRDALKPTRPAMQVMRGVTLAAATVTFVMGATSINYADAIAILYAYPFLLTVFAALFLREQVHPAGWFGIGGGFVGVLLVMRPDFGALNQGTLWVFASAVIVSVQLVFNRQLGKSSNPLVTSLWGAVVAGVVLSALVWKVWQPLTQSQLLILVFIAVLGTISQVCIVYSFARAEASVLAPFTYFEIVAAVIFGFLLFDTLPGYLSWFGIALIAASGMLVAKAVSAPVAPRRNPKI